jgi:hypothetical protein
MTYTLTITPSGEPHGTMTSYRVHDARGVLISLRGLTACLRALRGHVSGYGRGVGRRGASG